MIKLSNMEQPAARNCSQNTHSSKLFLSSHSHTWGLQHPGIFRINSRLGPATQGWFKVYLSIHACAPAAGWSGGGDPVWWVSEVEHEWKIKLHWFARMIFTPVADDCSRLWLATAQQGGEERVAGHFGHYDPQFAGFWLSWHLKNGSFSTNSDRKITGSWAHALSSPLNSKA